MDTNLTSFVQTLKDKGVLCEVVPKDVFQDDEGSAILAVDYAPSQDKPTVSFAFTTANSGSLGAKCWISKSPNSIKIINNAQPIFHLSYRKFFYRDVWHYPYSVKLQSFTWEGESILKACHELYAHTEV